MFPALSDPLSLTNLVLLVTDLNAWIPELSETWSDYDRLLEQLDDVKLEEYWTSLRRDVDHGIPSIYD